VRSNRNLRAPLLSVGLIAVAVMPVVAGFADPSGQTPASWFASTTAVTRHPEPF
jgi:hypothetical protein